MTIIAEPDTFSRDLAARAFVREFRRRAELDRGRKSDITLRIWVVWESVRDMYANWVARAVVAERDPDSLDLGVFRIAEARVDQSRARYSAHYKARREQELAKPHVLVGVDHMKATER